MNNIWKAQVSHTQGMSLSISSTTSQYKSQSNIDISRIMMLSHASHSDIFLYTYFFDQLLNRTEKNHLDEPLKIPKKDHEPPELDLSSKIASYNYNDQLFFLMLILPLKNANNYQCCY